MSRQESSARAFAVTQTANSNASEGTLRYPNMLRIITHHLGTLNHEPSTIHRRIRGVIRSSARLPSAEFGTARKNQDNPHQYRHTATAGPDTGRFHRPRL